MVLNEKYKNYETEMEYFEGIKRRICNWQTLTAAKEMYEDYLNKVGEKEHLIKRYRIKDNKYPFKILCEEYYPLIKFATLMKYGEDCEIRYVGEKTQSETEKYDGEIKRTCGEVVQIEIVCPKDGKEENNLNNTLNKDGFAEEKGGSVDEMYEEEKELIMQAALKKSQKDYSNSMILICLPESIIRIMPFDEEYCTKEINEIVKELKAITYKAKKVYCMIPKSSVRGQRFDGELVVIQEERKRLLNFMRKILNFN